MTFLRFLTISLVALPLFVACGKTSDKDDDSGGDDELDRAPKPELSLTIPSDARSRSKFCPAEAPKALPEDPTPAYRFTNELLDGHLKGKGLNGWMHGVVHGYKQYIFTYRSEDQNDAMAFFKAEQFSLVPASDQIAAEFAKLNRHDKVRLFGQVLPNKAAFVHLLVTKIEVVKRYGQATENSYDFNPGVIGGKETFEVFGLVHATIDGGEKLGRGFVVEHENYLIPVMVDKQHDTVAAKLYRGDIVNVHARFVQHPNRPPHVTTDAAVDNAIEIVDPMVNCHGLKKTLTGYLVKFAKSPAISTDVYAVQVVDANGILRNYTFFPDAEDPEKFMEIFFALADKAKAAWGHDTLVPEVVRNYWKKTHIKVKVSGTLNVVSLEQANPQVYIKDPADLTFTFEK